MKNTFFIFSILAAAFAARANIILLDADLQNIAVPTTYTNNAIINASGAPHERLFVGVGVNNTNTDTCRVDVVQLPFDANRKMLRLMCPATGSLTRGDFMLTLHNFFPNPTPLSEKGYCYVEGQFDIVFGLTSNTVEINGWLGHDENPDNGLCRFYVSYAGNGPIIRPFYGRNLYPPQPSVPNFNTTQTYRMYFHGDMSNGLGSDFRWDFKITRLGTPAWEWGTNSLARSSQNVPTAFPDRFVFRATSMNVTCNTVTAPVLYVSNFQIKARPKFYPTLFLLK